MRSIFSFPVKMFLWLIRHPRVTAGIGVFFLVSLLWVAGPWFGLASREIKLYLTIGIILCWLVFVMIDQYHADRGARLLEESIRKQVQDQIISSRPDHKEKIEALRNEFEKAIASLKQSKLGSGKKGSSALYALPWYMFIGPPASGKSTALLHSGLQFPSLGLTGKGIQGIGGTRNCDWWFTSESVLLDTAGRYVTEEEDREEWFNFLKLLKKHRKNKPINGVLAAISVTDLLQGKDEEIEWHANNIRARIDELIQQLGIVFPVYILFTKCDLVQGFVEFFEDFGKGERDQVWGATFSKKQASADLPGRLFETEYRLLSQALYSRRTSRLFSARGSRKTRDIFGFPLQITSCRDQFVRFVEILFQHNPYKENPLFRGFYFTSGTQEGTPIDRILGNISRASGLPDPVSESFELQREPKSYFIKRLFTDVIFPDELLANSSSNMARQRGFFRVGIFIISFVGVILLCTAFLLSFIANEHLIVSVNSDAQRLSRLNAGDEKQFESNIKKMDSALGRLSKLRNYEIEGPPFRLKLGFYRGTTLYPPLKSLYMVQFDHLFVEPTKAFLEAELAGFVSDPAKKSPSAGGDFYSLLKVYLMLSDPAHRDAEYLSSSLADFWKDYLVSHYGEKAIPKGLQEATLRQIQFYSQVVTEEKRLVFSADSRLVTESQKALRDIPVAQRIYNRIKSEPYENLKPFTVDTPFQNKPQNLLFSPVQVPAIFTEKGWKSSFKEQVPKIISESAEQGWVLGESDINSSHLTEEIENIYFRDFIREWERFLESIRMKSSENLLELSTETDQLSSDDSPLRTLLAGIVKETDLSEKPATEIQGTSLVEKVKKGLRLDSPSPSVPAPASNPVTVRFRSLAEFVQPEDNKKISNLTLYLSELKKIHDTLSLSGPAEVKLAAQNLTVGGASDLGVSYRNSEKILQSLDPELRRAIGPLLLQPYKNVFAGIMKKTELDLVERWKSEVYQPCVQSIGGRYPFKQDGEEASITDVAEFFQPQNGVLWRFFEKELKPYIDTSKDPWEAKKGSENGIQFSPDFLVNLKKASQISESFFPRGNSDPQIPFDLYPYPSPGVSEIVIRVAGKDIRYRNEPQEWHELSWPGSLESGGALIQVSAGKINQMYQFPGRWGLFKMLDAGKVTPVNSTRYQVEWKVKVQESQVINLRFDLRAQSFKNPFKPGLFSDFHCVSTL